MIFPARDELGGLKCRSREYTKLAGCLYSERTYRFCRRFMACRRKGEIIYWIRLLRLTGVGSCWKAHSQEDDLSVSVGWENIIICSFCT